MTDNNIWTQSRVRRLDTKPPHAEKSSNSHGVSYKNKNFDHNSLTKENAVEILEDKEDNLERVGVFVDMEKQNLYFYHGTRGKMQLIDPNEANSHFVEEEMFFNISFGGGYCRICDDATFPEQLPEGYEWLLGWSQEYYRRYPEQIKMEILYLLLVRKRVNESVFKSNKVPKVLILHTFNFLLENRNNTVLDIFTEKKHPPCIIA